MGGEEALNEPATKGFVRQELASLEARMDERFAAGVANEIGRQAELMRKYLDDSLKHHVGVVLEHVQKQINAVDEKVQDLPRRVAALEAVVLPGGPKRTRKSTKR